MSLWIFCIMYRNKKTDSAAFCGCLLFQWRVRNPGRKEMKKMYSYAAAMSAALILTGCGRQAEQAKPQETPVPSEAAAAVTETPRAEEEKKVGGWEINTEFNCYLTEEEISRFEKAMDGMVGVSYEPVDILASQVVSGSNYAYLCMSKTVTAEPRSFWSMIVVYEPLDGNPVISRIQEIDVLDLRTKEAGNKEAVTGGWTIREASGKPVMFADENATAAAEAVMFSQDGLALKPAALLATQLVSGTNYKVLERGETENGTDLYVTTIYRDLQGNTEITDNQLLDLLYYVNLE